MVVHEWVYVLIVAIPTLGTLAGVIWQGRKTRNKGTEEHQMARQMLESHGQKLDELGEDVRDVKADVRDLKAADRQLAQGQADIRRDLDAAQRSPLYGLGEGK